jgi:hypothetical protein
MATATTTTTTSCGLKNSGCRPDLNVTTSIFDDPLAQRFSFVDGMTGLWTVGHNEYATTLSCPVGGLIVFHYPVDNDIVQLPSRQYYESCHVNETNVILLSPNHNSSASSLFPETTYYFNCTQPGVTSYLTSSVPGQCAMGQRIAIETSDTAYTYNATTGTSVTRLLVLLGYRKDKDDPSYYIMDRGFQTEALANATVELIRSALDECPMANDFTNSNNNSNSHAKDDCEAIVYTLLGYVSRKRPVPQWDEAVEYYNEAIQRGGPNECAARSYLTQLYLNQRTNRTQALAEIMALCTLCNNDDDALLIQQAKREYERLGIESSWLEWPEAICADAPQSYTSSSGACRVGELSQLPSSSSLAILMAVMTGWLWRLAR